MKEKEKTAFHYVVAIAAGTLFLFLGEAVMMGRLHSAPFNATILNFAVQSVELGFLGFFLAPKKQGYGYVYLVGFLACIAFAITKLLGPDVGMFKILEYYYLSGFALLAWSYAGEDAARMVSDMDADPMVRHDLAEYGRLRTGFAAFAERAKEQASAIMAAKSAAGDAQFRFPNGPETDIMGTSPQGDWWDPEYEDAPPGPGPERFGNPGDSAPAEPPQPVPEERIPF